MTEMIPAGYMLKKYAPRPDWLKAPAVADIYSVSGCIAAPFADYINFWKHNGYWFFDAPEILRALPGGQAPELDLFYYEVYAQQYDERKKEWQSFSPEASFTTAVKPPKTKLLAGYDVVTFWARTSPECSPLSCNNLAETVPVNAHCLLDSFDAAKKALDAGAFDNSEPGPFRIFAVYVVPEALQ
jgi:hypothetical protein